jgi:hypothetical protein
MGRRAATMRETRIATRRDHKQEASFPQAVFLFPETDEKIQGLILDCKFDAPIIQSAILGSDHKVFRDDKRNFRYQPARDK